MTEHPDVAAFLRAHREARGGEPLNSPPLPEQFGPFQFWRSGQQGDSWGISDGGGWYPIRLADRDACLVFAGAAVAALGMAQIEALRDQYNQATPPVGVTARHLFDALHAVWPEVECDDCGHEGPDDGSHRCGSEEPPK